MALKNGLLISIGTHVAILIFAIISVRVFPNDHLDLSQAIRVDVVDLPDKTLENELPDKVQDILKEKTDQDLPTPKEAKTEKPEPKIKEKIDKKAEATISLSKSKQKQKAAMEKLKKLSALDKIKEDVETENQRKLIKGRILSAGTIPKGLDKLQSDSYLSQLDLHIKSNWSLPQWLIGKPLKSRVHVKFDEKGRIISKKLTATSGNPTYDEYCMLAVEKSAPFPPVPDKFANIYKYDGVTFAFPE